MSVALFVTMLLGATPSPAELSQAKAYFDGGRQAYDAREYLAAALAFEQAYDLSHNAAVLFSTAQAYRLHFLLERSPQALDRAIDLYRQYLVEVDGGSRRADAAEHLASLELQLAQLSPELRSRGEAAKRTQIMIASRTEGARVRSDDGDHTVPLVREVEPGVHRVTVTKPGYFESSVEVVAVEGRLVVAQVDLLPMPAKLTVAAPQGSRILVDGRLLGEAPIGSREFEAGRRLVTVQARGKQGFATEVELARGEERIVQAKLEDTGQRTFSYVVLGLGGAGLATAVTTGILAGLSDATARLYLTRRDRLQEELAPSDLDTYIRARDAKSTLTRAFWASLISGAVVTAAGGALYFLDSPSASTHLDISPLFDGDTVGVHSELTF